MKDSTGRLRIVTGIDVYEEKPPKVPRDTYEVQKEASKGPLIQIVASLVNLEKAERRAMEIRKQYGRARVDIILAKRDCDAIRRGEFTVFMDGVDGLGEVGEGEEGETEE